MDIDSEDISFIPKDKIELNDREKHLFTFLLDFVKAKDIKVILRSAGGWVRDKVNKLQAT